MSANDSGAGLTPEQAALVDRLTRPESALALTERQAQAFVLREIEGFERAHTADVMGVSTDTLDEHLAAARDKVTAARWTADVIDKALETVTAP